MNSYGKPSEESNTADMKRNMMVYCLNAMQKRTIDEQLVDLSAIMKSSMLLEIMYDKTELQVTYSVGSLNASVKGLDESKCVRQCKREILHKLHVFCMYTNSIEKTASVLQARYDKIPSSSSTLDAYSEIKLCKNRASKKTENVGSDQTVKIKLETEIPRELFDFMDYTRSPLVLKVKYFPTEWEMLYETGPYFASAKGCLKSTCMHQCKSQLMYLLQVFVNDARVTTGKNAVDREALSNITQVVARKELIGENRQRDPSNKTVSPAAVESVVARLPVSTELPGTRRGNQSSRSFNTPEAHEKYVNRATEVLRNITWHKFRGCAKRFFDILVQANHANRSYLKRITDCLVSNAIDNPDNCTIYAELCCDAMEKAWRDSRVAVRKGLGYAFKLDLIQSCRDVLTQAGLVLQVATVRRCQNGPRTEIFDAKARERTQATCRLMGELFVLDQMFKTVMGIVSTFVQTQDAHSLECLCVLLAIVGPKLEKTADDPRRVYEQLERYSVTGHAGNTPLPRRTILMIEHVLNMRKFCATTISGVRGVPAERKIPEGDGRRPRLQPEDHRAKPTPGPSILRRSRNRESSVSETPAQQRRTRVTFNPVVSILCFPRRR